MRKVSCSGTGALALMIVVCILSGGRLTKADFEFGTPTSLGPLVNSQGAMGSNADWDCHIASDGLSLIFASARSTGGGWYTNLWMSTRATRQDDWGPAEYLGDVINSEKRQMGPWLSADGLELYYAQGLERQEDIVVSRRNTPSDPWGAPENLGPMINSSASDSGPSLTADGLELYFDSSRSGREELYVSTRASTSDPWGQAMNLGPTVNSTYGDDLWGDGGPSISPDGLTLLFNSARPPGATYRQKIWMTGRSTREGEWGPPVLLTLPGYDTYGYDTYGDFTPSVGDGMLYFGSSRSGLFNWDLWQVEVNPIVDFNGDGIVDSADMRIMVDHWGTDDSLCDVAPIPWGDGIVDVQDLVGLSEHLFEPVNDPTLIAHWALDEIEGSTARDSISGSNDFVMGGALWQPDGGQVSGAIQLDGVDDVIIAGPPLNPADGPFSILAWVKGGAPGQVIISQPAGTNWLMADAGGELMTEVMSIGRGAGAPLLSQTVITDGQWHRIGLMWDGSNRTLCVDGVMVAEDTQSGLTASGGGLYIGAGSGLEPGTFWSGLIDEVRIYNRAVKP